MLRTGAEALIVFALSRTGAMPARQAVHGRLRYHFRATETYWAPRGNHRSRFSRGRSCARKRGKKTVYCVEAPFHPAS